ncbi:TonB family protein [Nitrospira sp. Kam-Ns4a]
MTAQSFFNWQEGFEAPRGPVARMLALSLALHLGLLAVALSVRINPKVQESLASYQVSLVTLPAPALAPTVPPAPELAPVALSPQPAKAAPSPIAPAPVAKPTPLPAVLAPAPPVRASSARREPPARPAPPVALLPHVAVKPRAPIATPVVAAPAPGQVPPTKVPSDDLGDLLRGLQAPAAPKLEEMQAAPVASPMAKAPARKPESSPLEKDVQALLSRAQVPDVPVPVPMKLTPAPVRPRSSLLEEVTKQLQAAPPAQTRPSPAPAEPQARSAVAARPPLVTRPQTTLKVAGTNSALSQYLALIQNKISALWTAPPVNLSGKPLQVVIRFRLHRTGSVTAVEIERTSGNGYYDDAGLRAIKAALPLPPFPSSLTEPYLDAHFSFTVGEQEGKG